MYSAYYKESLASFQHQSVNEIIGAISIANQFDTTILQMNSWEQQIPILKSALKGYEGTIFFEFIIPRMGKRVDSIVIIDNVVFVIEFKVGESTYHQHHVEQVWDYALDLKNFHKPSHHVVISPILVATEANRSKIVPLTTSHNDDVLVPIKTNKDDLATVIHDVLDFTSISGSIDGDAYATGSYHPTPTIIEAAITLYNSHSVDDITRSDADAKNLTKTTGAISKIISEAKNQNKKIICFVTGVPGAGKTLVGLKVATTHMDEVHGDASVYLSGNAPLVAVLQEALARDKVSRELLGGIKITKREAKQAVKSFIQIIHHYRDEYLNNPEAPYDHVAIFDEAQRAWDKEQTVKFMRMKKNRPDFDYSEPEFLISCLDRHKDWAVIVCLVGGGQEINTGEAGISEWLDAVSNKFPQWEVSISSKLTDADYFATDSIKHLVSSKAITFDEDLHLGVSMRSFRAENLSHLIQNILDLKLENAQLIYEKIKNNYPIYLTRDIVSAKKWLKEKARGSERYGMIVSSQAQRLKPYAIDVKTPINPVNWFLNGKNDIRSSFYLEDVATEFHIQGLELDWACVAWDGDLRYSKDVWETFSFKGSKWQKIHQEKRKKYLINAYRVLLTRARQGMVIVVPNGTVDDHTRKSEYYDSTYSYLKKVGFNSL